MPNMNPKKLPAREQAPDVRNKNFDEVSQGYDEAMAMEEAARCLNCKHRPCVSGCPVNVRIPEFIQLVKDGKFLEAYDVITSTNGLRPSNRYTYSVPAGDAVRVALRARHQGRAGGHRPAGAVRGGLRHGARRKERGARGEQRQARRGRRQRPGRADLRGRFEKARLRRDRVRGAAHAGRRARVRHSGVPPAQEPRAPRDQHARGHGREDRDEHGHRPVHLAGRAAHGRGVRRGVRRLRRGAAALPRASRART